MDANQKKTVLRMIPYALYVLTVTTKDSIASGTINWVTQASFEPPLLALGVKADTRSFANLQAGGAIALSFLGSGQGDLAFAFFADPTVEGDEFVTKKGERIPFERRPSGAIVLKATPGWAEAKLRETVAIGDHAVAIVEVTDVGQRAEQPQALTLKELNLNYGG